jgi:predicted MFS family arabinose efflux permease
MTDLTPKEECLNKAAVRPAANFVLYSVATGISAVGTWMQKAGVGWMAWELTHSPVWVGAMALTEVLSAIWVAPLAGTVADCNNPYRMIWATQSLAILQAAILALLAWTHVLNIWGLFALALVEATIQGFNHPVRMTTVGLLAGPERLSQAIASNSVAFNLARTIGPVFGGIAIQQGGTAINFLVNAVSYTAMLAAIVYLKPWLDRPTMFRRSHVISEIAVGIRYIRGAPEICRLLIVTGVVSLFARPFAEMFPALVGAVFGGGPETLSLLMSSQGAGAMLGALWMLRRHSPDRLQPIVVGCSLGLSGALVVFSSSIALTVAVPAMVIAGICHVMFSVALQSMAQMKAAADMKGRVMGIYWLLFRCCPSLGAFIIGLAANLVGLQLLIGGAAFIAGLFSFSLVIRWRREPVLPAEPAQ